MNSDLDETRNLLERIRRGDTAAFDALFKKHRGRLQKAIAMRMDRRVAARLDSSDILQETYLEAFKRLPKYLRRETMPFYLWIHWIAREKVIGSHRHHLGAEKRAVQHEVPLMPVDSSAQFVSGLIGRLPSPSQKLAKVEIAEKLRLALQQMSSDERDLILWRHFEQFSTRDMAILLDITAAAANKRYIRALERLRKLLHDLGVSNPPT